MDLNLSFNRPTTYTDGTPLDPADIVSYLLSGTVTAVGQAPVPANVVPSIIPGNETARLIHVNNANPGDLVCLTLKTNTATRQSDPSEAACITMPALKPNPPSDLTVTVP